MDHLWAVADRKQGGVPPRTNARRQRRASDLL